MGASPYYVHYWCRASESWAEAQDIGQVDEYAAACQLADLVRVRRGVQAMVLDAYGSQVYAT